MYTPHTVTVYNAYVKDPVTLEMAYNVTILRGVMFTTEKGSGNGKSGLSDEDNAAVYIPFTVKAVDGFTGAEKTYCEPKEFNRLADKDGFWTLQSGGESSGVDCFVIKGEVVSTDGIKALKKEFDNVFDVNRVITRDFGSARMQHWQAVCR